MIPTHNDAEHAIFVDLSGQDDNLGDSALREGLLRALRRPGRHLHIYLRAQTSDYVAGLTTGPDCTVYDARKDWLRESGRHASQVHVYNAGEINTGLGRYPTTARALELERLRNAGGAVIATGVGIKEPDNVTASTFYRSFRDATIMAWRDIGSCAAAGFGDVYPDWAFALGTHTGIWRNRSDRPLLAVTMRFDRPYPEPDWFDAVRTLASTTGTRIVTFAQVSRDAPRAVRLASDLDGEYLVAQSFSHAALDAHVREIFRRSLAVVTDRAHGLIIAATEGSFPIGSGSHPGKIQRLLATVGLGALVGQYSDLPEYGGRLEEELPTLAPAVDRARERLGILTARIDAVVASLG